MEIVILGVYFVYKFVEIFYWGNYIFGFIFFFVDNKKGSLFIFRV